MASHSWPLCAKYKEHTDFFLSSTGTDTYTPSIMNDVLSACHEFVHGDGVTM